MSLVWFGIGVFVSLAFARLVHRVGFVHLIGKRHEVRGENTGGGGAATKSGDAHAIGGHGLSFFRESVGAELNLDNRPDRAAYADIVEECELISLGHIESLQSRTGLITRESAQSQQSPLFVVNNEGAQP